MERPRKGLNWDEFDSSLWGLDSEKAAHDEEWGSSVAEYLLGLLSERGLSLSAVPRYLGIGAGMAYPELAFAQTLGIAPSNITLLDKNFGWEALKRIQAVSPDTTVVDRRGLWSFLENPDIKGFSVVSLFGLDHKLRDCTVPHLSLNLPKILVPNSVVCICPGGVEKLSELWEQQGFTVLINGRMQAYYLNSGQ